MRARSVEECDCFYGRSDRKLRFGEGAVALVAETSVEERWIYEIGERSTRDLLGDKQIVKIGATLVTTHASL
ncbi:hypothetical protein TIFTF001_034164 [Ficus carica]|uniref:Uncharacterized protein n=1 Tax=Ficus carica TaxID=3494 RepID=A0AA88E383_FICCA|nr:hypothetical protein TIFTF001_034164 [Ficus carica]